jgi:tetratricopeptide (TPR) repeat protein
MPSGAVGKEGDRVPTSLIEQQPRLRVVTSANSLSAVAILDQAQSGRIVLQDYRPLTESLEWELGQEYLRQRGSLAFISDPEPVPWVVNNDGNQSIRSAEVFFTSLLVAEEEGKLEKDIVVLELGIGVGLFARYFLDWFKHLSDTAGKDYYDRLCYVAADHSHAMLRDAGRRGVFQNHPGRYRLRLVDALKPARLLNDDAEIGRLGPRPFRAVFLNYVLDCLPACVVKVQGEDVQVLHARTSLPPGTEWKAYLGANREELQQMAASPDPLLRRQLLAVYRMVLAEYQYRPVPDRVLPYAEFIREQAGQVQGMPVLHNHGALLCLEALLKLLAEDGIILISDYGITKEIVARDFEHQRFSQTTAVGVNFPLLGRYFSDGNRACWRDAGCDEGMLHSRLLMHRIQAPVAIRFAQCYGEEGVKAPEEPVKRARELGKVGRLQAALGQYREALARQPFSWVLMHEVAHFLTFANGNAKAGVEMARAGLRHNPGCSADLWNMLGDSLFLLGRMREARLAFEQALAINSDDVRARYNLAFVHTQATEYEQALVRIAEGLARDQMGKFHKGLLQKQAEVLVLLHRQSKQRYLGLADRVTETGPAGLSELNSAMPVVSDSDGYTRQGTGDREVNR